jgi:hypothetical protein
MSGRSITVAVALHLALGLAACAVEGGGPQRAEPAEVGPSAFIEATGLFGLVPHDAPPAHAQVRDFLEHPHFAGLSVRTGWDDVEPVENVYDWSYLDSMIAEAQTHGKKIMLRVRPSWETPDWVYDAGAEPFWYYERNDGGKLHRMPVPWDPVFQAKWADFIAELGRRYAGHPDLVHVLVTGASRSDCEMYLPSNGERASSQATWEAIGYTPSRLIDAWKHWIDGWAAALPRTLVSLSLSSALYDDGVVEEVADYCTSRYPWRVALKISYWSAGNDPTFAPTRAFLSRIDERTHGGVEAVSLLSDMPDAARDAISWHAVLWAEPYPSNRHQMQALYDEQQRHKRIVLTTRFRASRRKGQVALSWAGDGLEKVRILRRADVPPVGADDPLATIVHEGDGSSALDGGMSDATPLYYALFELPSKYTVAFATALPR